MFFIVTSNTLDINQNKTFMILKDFFSTLWICTIGAHTKLVSKCSFFQSRSAFYKTWISLGHEKKYVTCGCGIFINITFSMLSFFYSFFSFYQPHHNYLKVPKRGTRLWVSSFSKKLSIKSSLACCTLEPILKVGWNFWDLLFPPLKLWEGFRI